MRDPRNWVRPVVASAVGVTAGTALVVLRVRAERKKRAAASSDPLDLAAPDAARRPPARRARSLGATELITASAA